MASRRSTWPACRSGGGDERSGVVGFAGGSNSSSMGCRRFTAFVPGGQVRGYSSRARGRPPLLTFVQPYGVAKGFNHTDVITGPLGAPVDKTPGGGCLSWADIRRQPQWSGAQRPALDATCFQLPDKPCRAITGVGGRDGGWGGRGRGRLLDAASGQREGSNYCNVSSVPRGGRGRGGILFVPGGVLHGGVDRGGGQSNHHVGRQNNLSIGHSNRGRGLNKGTDYANANTECLPPSAEKQEAAAGGQSEQSKKSKSPKKYRRKQHVKVNGNADTVKSDAGCYAGTTAIENLNTNDSIFSSIQQSDKSSKSKLRNRSGTVGDCQRQLKVAANTLTDKILPARPNTASNEHLTTKTNEASDGQSPTGENLASNGKLPTKVNTFTCESLPPAANKITDGGLPSGTNKIAEKVPTKANLFVGDSLPSEVNKITDEVLLIGANKISEIDTTSGDKTLGSRELTAKQINVLPEGSSKEQTDKEINTTVEDQGNNLKNQVSAMCSTVIDNHFPCVQVSTNGSTELPNYDGRSCIAEKYILDEHCDSNSPVSVTSIVTKEDTLGMQKTTDTVGAET